MMIRENDKEKQHTLFINELKKKKRSSSICGRLISELD